MDKYLRPERLDADPSSSTAAEEWRHWKRTFSNFLEAFPDPPDKLKAITNFVSARVYRLVEDCTTYEEAIAALEAVYVKQKNEVFARYVLSTRRQQNQETIDQYIQVLHSLSKDCKFGSVTAEQHREECVRDSFISGLSSNTIRRRLLENKTLDLATALSQARTLDLAQKDSEFYSQSTTAIGVAAAVPSTLESENYEGIKGDNAQAASTGSRFGVGQFCFFCGGARHSRSMCPARDAACNKCGKKGHYSKVCNSATGKVSLGKSSKQSAAADSTPTRGVDSTQTAWMAATTASNSTSTTAKSTVTVEIDGTKLTALVDSGSTDSFIRDDLIQRLGLVVHPSKDQVYMAASTLSAKITGYCVTTIGLNGDSYGGVRLSVLPGLCADVILGQDFMGLHKEIIFAGMGNRPALKICGVAEAALNPPTLFGGVSADCQPIAAKSCRFSVTDKKFIDNEISRLLREEIIERSSSPWRAQLLVTSPANHKKRLVVDYSQTINKHTPLDAYPLPKIQELVETVAQYRIYSTLDLTSAYHQVPLQLEERGKTAFEANGELYQFRRLPFGLTNAVASFQRIMNDFIRDSGLEGYLCVFGQHIGVRQRRKGS